MNTRRNLENKVKLQTFYEPFEQFLIYLKLRTYETAETYPCQQKITVNQGEKEGPLPQAGIQGYGGTYSIRQYPS